MHDGRRCPASTGTLGDLARKLESRGLLRGRSPQGTADGPALSGVALDSRSVEPGDLFVAITGARMDGHAYGAQAVERGAVAIVAERPLDLDVPQLLVSAPRTSLAVAAAWLNDFPSHQLGVVGVTGTDGKTTTCFLTLAMLNAAGLQAGMISTVSTVVGGQPAGCTRQSTPEAPVLQADLRLMREAGDRFAVVESTSHGLALDRVAEVAYDVAVLTNITHEHLDLHGTIEAYVAAKRSLFDRLTPSERNPDKGWPKSAVINAGDGHAADFIDAARRAGARILTYSADAGADAHVQAVAIDVDQAGLLMRVRTPRWEDDLRIHLAGAYNAHNVLAAVGVGEALELDPAQMRTGIESVRAVRGRMERIDAGQEFEVFVDFAHTAAALGVVVDWLRPMAAACGGGVIAVFGSAGERDVQKRPMMGRVAGERCRIAILTNEEPRGEDEMSILEEIARGAREAGMKRDRDLFLITDRRAAIRKAFELARPGDIVVLAGKGHESTMAMAHGSMPWNEAEIASETLASMGYGSSQTGYGF